MNNVVTVTYHHYTYRYLLLSSSPFVTHRCLPPSCCIFDPSLSFVSVGFVSYRHPSLHIVIFHYLSLAFVAFLWGYATFCYLSRYWLFMSPVVCILDNLQDARIPRRVCVTIGNNNESSLLYRNLSLFVVTYLVCGHILMIRNNRTR